MKVEVRHLLWESSATDMGARVIIRVWGSFKEFDFSYKGFVEGSS